MALTALIFDVDGTLVDSNAAHVRAWEIALRKHNYTVSADRIGVEIGKGGDKLVPSILGDEIERRDGDSLRKSHTEEFKILSELTPLSIFPGTQELLRTARQRGLKLAIATSRKEKDLQMLERSAGVKISEWFDEVATGDHAQESKPSPGILNAAIEKLGISPAQCAMIGDTPYDADTSRDAGAICLGVTCGGCNDEQTLRRTGMRKVYRDPADILAHFNEALKIASPGPAVLTWDILRSLMREALSVAREGLVAGEAPIGCVIADGNARVLARGHNELNKSQDKTAHAEMVAFRRLAGNVPVDARDLILVSTLEPCVMCLGASMEAAIDTIIYGMHAPMDGGRTRVRPPVSPESQMPRIVGDVLAEESRRLFEEFLASGKGHPQQITFVKQLLTRS